jgi:hypothetical protein
MAEALAVLGLVSAIVQFVDFGSKIINRLDEFQSSIDEVPKTFRDIKNQLPLLIDTLKRTQNQAAAGCVSEQTAKALNPVIEGCSSQVQLLSRILDKSLPANNASNWQKRLYAIRSLAHENDILQITSKLKNYIQLLTFHQATCNSDPSSALSGRTTPLPCSSDLPIVQQKPILQ